MFNIGPAELIVILIVALLIVGPKRLPEVGKTIGRSLREFRRAQEDLKNTFTFDLDEPEPAKPRPSPPPEPETTADDAPSDEDDAE